jgi:hypothetical protein
MVNPLLVEGMADAVGFVAGALTGFGLASLFGFDIFATGYGGNTIAGIVLVGLGGGIGLQASRRWLAWQRRKKE